MPVPAVSTATTTSATTPPKPRKNAPPPPAQNAANQPAATVTLSPRASRAATPSPAPAPVIMTQTSPSSYIAKVRTALANNPNLTLRQAMTMSGVPQAEQQQVSSALGSTKQYKG